MTYLNFIATYMNPNQILIPVGRSCGCQLLSLMCGQTSQCLSWSNLHCLIQTVSLGVGLVSPLQWLTHTHTITSILLHEYTHFTYNILYTLYIQKLWKVVPQSFKYIINHVEFCSPTRTSIPTLEINTKITISWALKKFVTRVHISFSIYHLKNSIPTLLIPEFSFPFISRNMYNSASTLRLTLRMVISFPRQGSKACFTTVIKNYQGSVSESGICMMMSSNGNIFRVIGHLCGEFTGHQWIPHTKASDAEL